MPGLRGARSDDDDIAEPREAAAGHGDDVDFAERDEAAAGAGDVPSRFREAGAAGPVCARFVAVGGAYVHGLGWLRRYGR